MKQLNDVHLLRSEVVLSYAVSVDGPVVVDLRLVVVKRNDVEVLARELLYCADRLALSCDVLSTVPTTSWP